MRPTYHPLPGAAWQGVVRLALAPWWPVRLSGAVGGHCRGVVHTRLCRRPGDSGRLQAG